MEELVYDKKGPIAWITINRPEKKNALTRGMYTQMQELISRVEKDDDVRVLILTGNGDSFSAGADLTQPPPPGGHRNVLENISNPVSWQLWNLSKPSIAMVRGYALGGGCELALSCDFVIASEEAILGEPEIQYGIAPDFLIVPWLIGLRKSKELLMMGQNLSGKEAADMGLINWAVKEEQLEKETLKVAKRLTSMSSFTLKLIKKQINNTFEIQGIINSIKTAEEISINNQMAKKDYDTEEFRRIARQKGLRAALTWHEAQLSEA